MKKNKLIINIILVYFVLLAIVLVAQMRISDKSRVTTEPLKDSVHYSDILSECVVLYERSPVMLVEQKQMLVNDENAACVPIIENNSFLVPVEFFKQAYGAVVSGNEDRQTATIRLDNNALVIDGQKNVTTLVSASGEEELSSVCQIKFKNDTAYISLDGFAEGFNKKLSVYKGMAVLSNTELKLDEEELNGFMAEVEPQVNNLPSVDEQKKLEELLGSGAVNIFNALGEGVGIGKEESPITTLGFDSSNTNIPGNIRTDGKYIYFIRENALNIVTVGEKPVTISRTDLPLTEIYGIYINGNYVSVVGQRADESFTGCTISVYDTLDKKAPVLTREIGAEGDYSLACKKDNIVYLFVKQEAESADSYDIPDCFDSANTAIGETKSLSDVRYVPEMADKAYTTILAFNINDMARALNVYRILGCGDNYSITGESLYISAKSSEGTSMYKLSLSDGGLSYASAAYTKMNIPDSACVNEYNGILRVASENKDKVQVALLDEKMEEISVIEDIPVEGNMVSARFIGSRGYLVSDDVEKAVYAVDLTDTPKEIGTINIPSGAVAVRNVNADNFICIKADGSVAMLNIADINNQQESFTVSTGGKIDADNILLNTDEGILALPVEFYTHEQTEVTTVSEVTTLADSSAQTEETTLAVEETTEVTTNVTDTFKGEPVAQGVCVYKIDLTKGEFTPVDTITHSKDQYSQETVIKTILYKDGRLYSVSDKEIKSSYIK